MLINKNEERKKSRPNNQIAKELICVFNIWTEYE